MRTKTVKNIQISFTSMYAGNLKKSIAGMEFDDDTSEVTEDMLFDRHYKILKKLHHDSLIILDNFNVLPKDNCFFKNLPSTIGFVPRCYHGIIFAYMI